RQSFSQKRDAEKRTKSTNLRDLIGVFGVGQNVEDVNDFAFKQDAARHCSTVDASWMTCGKLGVFLGNSIGSFEVKNFALGSTYGTHLRLAKARRRFNKRIEHRLQVESRTTDNLQHVGGGGLLLQ